MEPQYGKYLANHFRWLLWTWNHGFQIGGAAVRKSGGEDQTFLIFDQGLRDMIDLNFLIFNQGPRDMIDLNFPIFDQEPRDTEIQQKILQCNHFPRLKFFLLWARRGVVGSQGLSWFLSQHSLVGSDEFVPTYSIVSRVPGLPIRECARECNNRNSGQEWAQ